MTEPDPQADWWTTADVAAYLGVSRGTVSAYRSRGQMPAPDRYVGREPVWRPAAVVEWHAHRRGRGWRRGLGRPT